MTDRNTKQSLADDIGYIIELARSKEYLLTGQDIFALGYLSSRYGLDRLVENLWRVQEAVDDYDKTDDLALHESIGETLIDLGILQKPK